MPMIFLIDMQKCQAVHHGQDINQVVQTFLFEQLTGEEGEGRLNPFQN